MLGQSFPTYGGQSKVWFGSAIVSSGVATFYPTDDGTAQGKSVFMSIVCAFACVNLNAAKAVEVAMAAIKSVSPDRTTIDVCAVTGKSLLALGDSMQVAPDGTIVYLQVWGS